MELFDQLLEYVITEYRAVFSILFLLPLSVIFECFLFFRNKFEFWVRSAPKKHDSRVKYIQKQVQDWNKEGSKVPMCTARPGWMAMSPRVGKYKKTHKNIHIDLHDILEIDTQRRVVRVEPLVTMGQITSALNPLGWTLAVVPELDDLTVGGLLMGFGVETSSHKYGLFQYTCVAYEVVMADGSLVRATAKENSDLFYALPWSHGTLGFMVSAEIQIVRAKNFVKVDYYPVRTRKEGLALFEKESRNTKNDFVEALTFSENDFVIMIGNLTDSPQPQKINAIGNFWKPWFYTHVETFLKNGPDTEYIPLRHYYHRHTRSLFWELEDIIPCGNHPIFRYLLGWATPPKVSLLKLFNTQSLQRLYELHHVDQDFLVPMKSLDKCLQACHQEFRIYPMWLCPMKVFRTEYRGFVNPSTEDDLFVDIGIYGVPKTKSFVAKPSTRNVERVVREEKGFQALYADTYATYEEFREMFDHKLYDSMRSKYKCGEAFPEVYQKVNKQARM